MNTRGLLSKFPTYAKPSYEAFIHKKVHDEYDLAVAIPSGKRAFLWFTMSGKKEICCIVEIGRNQMLQDNIHTLDWNYPHSFSLGTLLSGYLLDGDESCPNHKYFIADDLFSFEGYEFGNPYPLSFARKFEAFSEFFKRIKPLNGRFSIHCIVMWHRSISNELPPEWASKIGYKVKHIQYRSAQKILPFANYIVSKNPWECGGPQLIDDAIDYIPRSTVWSDVATKFKKEMRQWNVNFFAPIHTRRTLFWVSADITYDMYYLFVRNDVLYQYAFIPDHKTSVMMNSLFRRIVENDCLDKVEESEDEEEFENIRDDKYVDLGKKVLMECVFHQKFKKWVPLNLATKPGPVPAIEDFLHATFKYTHNTNDQQRYKSYQSAPNRVRIQECGRKKEKNQKNNYQGKKKNFNQAPF